MRTEARSGRAYICMYVCTLYILEYSYILPCPALPCPLRRGPPGAVAYSVGKVPFYCIVLSYFMPQTS